MTNILQRVRKHAALPAAVLAVAIIAAIFVRLYGLKDRETIELHHLSGDPSVLADLVIDGAVSDSYHRTAFTIENGVLRKQTELYEEPFYVQNVRYSPGARLKRDDREYEVHPSFLSGTDFDIVYYEYRNRRHVGGGTAKIDTGLAYASSNDYYTLTNAQEYGLAFVGDRIFYAPPTTLDYKGTSGIYEVTKFHARSRLSIEQPPEQESRLLAELDLNGNSAERREGIEILGLEAAGDKLALVVLLDGKLAVRGYHSDSGQMIGEVRLEEKVWGPEIADAPGDSETEETSSEERYYQGYAASADDDIGVLNLKFRSSLTTNEKRRMMVVSVALSDDGLRLLNKAKLCRGDEEYGDAQYSYRNGKLYEAEIVYERNADQYVAYDALKPKRLLLRAYEGERLVYEGEIGTDVNDDNVQASHIHDAYAYGLAYDGTRFRRLEPIRFAGISGEEVERHAAADRHS